jgi:hypothetical protein
MAEANAAVEVPPPADPNADADLARRLFSVVDPTGAAANAQIEGADDSVGKDVNLRLPNDSQNDEPVAPTEPETYAFEIDGQTVQLTEAQLIDAVAKSAKPAEPVQPPETFAAERAQLTAQRQQLETLTQQNYERLSALLKYGQPDWDSLLRNDPQEFTRQQWEWQKIGREYQAVLDQKQALEQQTHQERMTQMQQVEARERATLLTKLPEWKDSSQAEKEQKAIASYLSKTYGYTQDTIDRIQDHREVIIARKAMLYDQLMDAAKNAKGKVRQLPPRTERPGITQAQTPQENTRANAMRRLARTGSVDDAANVFSAIFNEDQS